MIHTFTQILTGPLRGYLTRAALCVTVNKSSVGVSQTSPDSFSSHAWAAVLTKREGGYGCQAVYWEHEEYVNASAQFHKAPLGGYSIRAALCLTSNQSNVGLSQNDPDNFTSHTWAAVLSKTERIHRQGLVYWDADGDWRGRTIRTTLSNGLLGA